ncbi:MAG: MMPL family transporter [Deltaproteobacteria bacterium]|nr:MMPL family transporter [Deltaproteobacteria bacterium]
MSPPSVAGRIGAFAVGHRRAVLLGSAVLTLASLLSLTQLRLDVDLLSTLPTGTAAFDDYKQFLETFGALQTAPVLVSGVSGPDLGRAIDRLAAGYRALPQIASVIADIDAAADVPFLDPLHVPAIVPAERLGDLAARLEPDAIATALAQTKKLLAMPSGGELTAHLRRDPLGLALVAGQTIRARYADPLATATDPHILAPDGSAGIMLLEPKGSPFDGIFTAQLFDGFAAVEHEVRTDPAFAALRIQHGGAHAHAQEDARLIQRDVFRYTLLAFVGVIAIFQIGFRNLGILPLIGYQLAAGSLFAFATSVIVYRQLNALSLCFAAIFYGLAIDSVIYFYSRLVEERRRAPLAEAIARTCAGLGVANVVASTTTAAAFAVIAFSAMSAVRQIGVLTAIGMLVNIANTFIVLPALVATFPGRLADHTPATLDAPRLGAVAGASARHPAPALAVTAAIVVGWLVFRPPLPVDANVLHLRATDSRAAEAEDAMQEKFGGLAPQAHAVVVAPDLEAALAREEQVVAWLEARRAQPDAQRERRDDAQHEPRNDATLAIDGYQALTTFLPSRATEAKRRAAFAQLPLARAHDALHAELVRQRFRVDAFADAEAALQPSDTALPRDLDAPWLRPLVARHLHRTAAGVTLVVMFTPAPGASLAAIHDRLRADVDVGDDVVVTGRSLMEAALDTVIARELVGFTIASLVLNVAIVLLQLRSVTLALAVMLPTVVVVLGMLEAMYLAGIAFTPINLIVLPLTLGIGVDYCVYVVQRWREGHELGTSTRLVGRAMALTTLTTMTGFGFLAVSRYRGLAGLGWLAMTAIAFAFAAAICLLPAFVAVVARGRSAR